MPTLERVPTDVVGNDLVNVYARGAARLNTLLRDGLRRGLDPSRYGTPAQEVGDATLAYYERQSRLAFAILAEVKANGAAAVPQVTTAAYSSSLLAIDRVLDGQSSARGTFGGIHQGAVQVLAGNLHRSLEKAANTAATNVATVFQRAALLEGAIPPGGVAGVGFIGRRVDDAWRTIALEQIGGGQVALQTRRQISKALIARLVDEGVTDALTGFVDRAGRRWSLETYAEMAVRTTTREATSRGTVNRLLEHGADLVTITSHPHKADECTPYDGETFSLSGEDRRYARLPLLPPFHPRCRHVVGPAAVSLDDYERELERAAEELAAPPAPAPEPELEKQLEAEHQAAEESGRRRPPAIGDQLDAAVYGNRAGIDLDALAANPNKRGNVVGPGGYQYGPPTLPFPSPPDPPFSPAAAPTYRPDSAELLEAQRIADLITGDPGPEPGYLDAIGRELETIGRREVRALNKRLGPDLVKVVNSAWGKRNDWRGRLLRGDNTIDDLDEAWVDEWNARRARQEEREWKAEQRRLGRTRSIPCFVCGKFKAKAWDVCNYCGDTPGSVDTGNATTDYRSDEHAFNRGYDYAY